MNNKILTPEEVHGIIQKSFTLVTELYGNLPNLSMDTVFSIGEATGVLSKAKALVGRDIDDIRTAAKADNTIKDNISQMETSFRSIGKRDLFRDESND